MFPPPPPPQHQAHINITNVFDTFIFVRDIANGSNDKRAWSSLVGKLDKFNSTNPLVFPAMKSRLHFQLITRMIETR